MTLQYVNDPQAAQLGDTVRDMAGMRQCEGVVVGVDTQGQYVLVRWDDAPHSMDVYSVESPVWQLFALLRHDDTQTEMPLEDTDTVHAVQRMPWEQ
jgi:hypothetical protein